MLPPALASVYREYKKDTNSIASWLASTAKECGYPADLLSNSPSPKQPAPRLKGKARAEAKKKANLPQEATPQKEGPRYVIEIKDFVPLAECISAYKKPALSVPQAFFTTLNRVIKARYGFGDELAASNEKVDAKSDARHFYFVGILEKVREILNPYSDPVDSGSSNETETLTNKFKELEVYHPSEKFLNAKDIERPRPANNDDVVYEADPGDSFSEALFAYKILLEDLRDIRKFVVNLWLVHIEADYGGNSLDPGVMAVVTNTAIEFGLTLAEDMKPIFEKFGGIGAMAEHIVSSLLLSEGIDMNKFRQQFAEGSIDEKVHTVMSQCCYITGLSIETLAKIPWTGVTDIYPDGTFGVLDPHTDWPDKSMSQALTEERVVIGELWTEAIALVYQVPDYPFSDEFLRGVKEFKETKQIPFSVIFAAEVILDVHKAIGSYAESSVDTLLKRITTMNEELKAHIEFQKDIKSPHWSSRDRKWLKDTQEGFDWFLDDPLLRVKKMAVDKSSNRQEGLNHLARVEKYRILKRSPILAGLALYYHRAEMHEAGLKVTNAWGSIILPAHLENAISEEGLTKTWWLDMETLFKIFGDEAFFVGGKPHTRSAYVNRFMLQVGISASTLSKNRRKGKKMALEDFSRAGPRFLKTRALIHKSLQDRYQRNANRMNWTMETISEVLSRGKSKDKGKGKEKDTSLTTDDKTRVTPADVLASLGNAMSAELEELAFSYLSLHQISWEWLRCVWMACDPTLRKIYGSDFALSEWELPFMVGHILSEAEKDYEGSMGMLAVAAGILEEMHCGQVLSKASRLMYVLSGRDYSIPKGAAELIRSFEESYDGGSDDDGPQEAAVNAES
ncbi:hypothetical protein H9Q72_006306 [Fusarium xylarioides]|uniref:DUF6604 domain-containing protein n=1 Tax=Fusarium xylarioides TaxID=221167 RepID=A0A9P7HTM3_9HYPO|nr:hypothetical protein H9Q72_006306 [Fusarium xylarioides]